MSERKSCAFIGMKEAGDIERIKACGASRRHAVKRNIKSARLRARTRRGWERFVPGDEMKHRDQWLGPPLSLRAQYPRKINELKLYLSNACWYSCLYMLNSTIILKGLFALTLFNTSLYIYTHVDAFSYTHYTCQHICIIIALL